LRVDAFKKREQQQLPQQQQQQLQQRRVRACPDLAGTGGLAGHAVNPAPRSGPAAGGWAFERMRGSASQAMRSHPWRLVGAIHGAQRSRQPTRTHPLTVFGCSTEKRWSTTSNTSNHSNHSNHSNQWVLLVLCVFCHGCQPTVRGGGVGGRGTVGRHGWRPRASRDGFTACPVNPHTPAQPETSQPSCFGFRTENEKRRHCRRFSLSAELRLISTSARCCPRRSTRRRCRR
jgi:hypothetical protein